MEDSKKNITNNSLAIIINKYLERGFGSMTKNDFEVWIFGYIIEMPEYKGKSNYELSVALHIPETKIKRLKYESALKAAKPETDYKQEVRDLLGDVELRSEDRKIIFQTEDTIIKSFVSSLLKKNGRMLDSSFNSELIVLKLEDYQFLAKEVYPKEDVEEVLKQAEKLSKESIKEPVTWNKVMGWVVEGAVSGVASGITSTVMTNLTPVGIINTIKDYLLNKR